MEYWGGIRIIDAHILPELTLIVKWFFMGFL